MDFVRGMVSKEKRRYTEDGFDVSSPSTCGGSRLGATKESVHLAAPPDCDSRRLTRSVPAAPPPQLDLTYITPRIIALGAPFEGRESLYRNQMHDVRRFLDLKHEGKHRIYDLRAEKGASYKTSLFHSVATQYRFFDHNPSPLKMLVAICEDMASWLAADSDNVVAVHCKAGKGRTGMVVSALLVRLGIAPTAPSALGMFGDERTNDGKGVTIPSQMRYVHYYEALRRGHSDVPKVYQIRHVRLHTVPNFDIEGGSDPFFDVRLGDGRECIFNLLQASGGRVKHYYPKERLIDLDVERFNIRVKGDVKMVFYDFDEVGSPDKMYHFWFNTAFVDNNYLLLHKAVLDRACKDKTCKEFEADFKMEIFLDCVDEKEGEFDKIKGEYLYDDVDEGGEGEEEEEGAE